MPSFMLTLKKHDFNGILDCVIELSFEDAGNLTIPKGNTRNLKKPLSPFNHPILLKCNVTTSCITYNCT